jgi:hypothetical protein
MLRRLALVIILAAIGAATAFAAPLAGKVQSTAGDTLVVVVHFDKVEWVKAGAAARVVAVEKGTLIGKCMIVGVADSTVTMIAPKAKAKALKPGASVTLEKPKAGMAGC